MPQPTPSPTTKAGEPRKPFTKAELARHIAEIQRIATEAQRRLAEGVWNPAFCASSGGDEGRALSNDLRECLRRMDRRIAAGAEAPSAVTGAA